MDKASFARKWPPATADQSDVGELATRPAGTPAEDEEIDEIKSAVLAKLALDLGKDASVATERDWFVAAALTIRDRIVHRWLAVERANYSQGRKRVYYLSLEFLIGRLLADVLWNLGCTETFRAALGDLGVDLNRLRAAEPDAALGHGGLGRLAACFMESMASLGIPACGYGIRYDHGLFRQVIRDGWQQEYPEEWLSFGNPWEFARPEVIYDIHFGGWVETAISPTGVKRSIWHPAETLEAVAYDIPIAGWRGRHVNPLRLWSARAVDPLRLDAFNMGDHVGALSEQTRAEAISKILYPSDSTVAGQELRLRQEYFFVSASLLDLVQRHMRTDGNLYLLPVRCAIQLNDTHPSIAVPELMRILVDLHGLPWDEAWRITVGTFSYTNHTLLPEALETWPVDLFGRVLPRHLEIIYRINTGHLAFVGSHRTNGVTALHTDLVRKTVFRELHAIYPDRIVNKTNGITFRRWLLQVNPDLTRVLREVCSDAVLDDPTQMVRLAGHAEDRGVQERVRAAKHANKVALARLIVERLDLSVDPDALFDVQIKRIHEYKRQLLNLLETVALYHAIRSEPTRNWVPRVKIFAGKAAANYAQAKLIIKLINDVAKVINGDPVVRDVLRVVSLPDYNVSLAERIIPAADISEQISTAGMEASGTGNMKLALNGAITIGTLDGANIEIRDHVGAENIFIFGLRAEEVEERRLASLQASSVIASSPKLAEAIEAIETGVFSPDDADRFAALMNALRHSDYYMVTVDFDAYYATQRSVETLWLSTSDWTRASMLNIARMAWFSSDRTVGEYAQDIWKVPFELPSNREQEQTS